MKRASMGLTRGLHGGSRMAILKLHRLLMFQQAFDDYVAGKVPASYVTARWNKLKECGLPRLK